MSDCFSDFDEDVKEENYKGPNEKLRKLSIKSDLFVWTDLRVSFLLVCVAFKERILNYN